MNVVFKTTCNCFIYYTALGRKMQGISFKNFENQTIYQEIRKSRSNTQNRIHKTEEIQTRRRKIKQQSILIKMIRCV